MSKFTKEELLKIKNEWSDVCKCDIDYREYRNVRIHYRRRMVKRAYHMVHWKRQKRMSEIMRMFKDDLMEYAEKKKYMTEDGQTILLE